MVHHPIVQKEVGELLAKGAIEQLIHDTGFLLKCIHCS